jgi:hypothetical protein
MDQSYMSKLSFKVTTPTVTSSPRSQGSSILHQIITCKPIRITMTRCLGKFPASEIRYYLHWEDPPIVLLLLSDTPHLSLKIGPRSLPTPKSSWIVLLTGLQPIVARKWLEIGTRKYQTRSSDRAEAVLIPACDSCRGSPVRQVWALEGARWRRLRR